MYNIIYIRVTFNCDPLYQCEVGGWQLTEGQGPFAAFNAIGTKRPFGLLCVWVCPLLFPNLNSKFSCLNLGSRPFSLCVLWTHGEGVFYFILVFISVGRSVVCVCVCLLHVVRRVLFGIIRLDLRVYVIMSS